MNLFSHDGYKSTDEHNDIENKVNNEMEKIKKNQYEDTFTQADIELVIRKLKNGKAVGVDSVPNEMFKYADNLRLSCIIATIFNNVIKYGLTINNFNVSLITPIPKKNAMSTRPEDYRPISVSNTISNIFEELLKNKISQNITTSEKQFGYKPKSSCKHASFLINKFINYYNNRGSPCYIVSLDIKKAFDRMWRQGLFYKLHDRIDKSLWRALVNYYSDSQACVKLSDQRSNLFKLTQGVKQGGVISPHLFNFFINDLLEECDSTNFGVHINDCRINIISYCDDLIIISPSIFEINKLLEICNNFANKWKIVLNSEKCNWYSIVVTT